MSAPERTTINKTLTSNPRGSKRGACDRCRGQKLRCLSDDQRQGSSQATCVRCLKAGATCSYTTAKRAGRSLGFDASFPSGGSRPDKGGIASSPTVHTSGQSGFFDDRTDEGQDRREIGGRGSDHSLGGDTVDQESGGEVEDTTQQYALSPLSMHDTSGILGGVSFDFPTLSASSTVTLPWPDENSTPFSNNGAGDPSGLEPFGSKHNWAFHQYQAQPTNIHLPNASPINSDEQSRYGMHSQIPSLNVPLSGMSDQAMDVDLPGINIHTTPFNPTKALNTRLHGVRDENREGQSLGMNSTANPKIWSYAEKGKKITPDRKELSLNQIQYRRMQDLSELALDLYTQLAANDFENQQPTFGATTKTFQDQLVGSVLKVSDTFLTLLISFSVPAVPSSPPALATPTPTMNHYFPYHSSDSSGSPSTSALDNDDSAMDEPVQNPHRKLPTGSSDESKPPPSIDMTTVLQLLTCYIRTIHLHSIMHARILDYVLAFPQKTADDVNSIPPVFPGMQIGGVSLNRFGTFQIKLLLQISVHLLGEIESVLGLPEEYRVGKRKGGGMGVLGASVSGGLLKRLMREGVVRGGKVECVREKLGKLRRVLNGTIDF